ncbi:hypothetical protein B0I24_1171 [Aliidiomarina maris]|uniref:Uncharacterized protein n=1 Tax=Aliidiomarina maris TaxID=531312 RepID=A0A327WRY0_9GAMM|nr:hypothetical protein B0I24_1171 [Aliidiomarina maris]
MYGYRVLSWGLSMRLWILFVTMCSLLSLPFSGTLAATDVMHDHRMQVTSVSAQHEHRAESSTKNLVKHSVEMSEHMASSSQQPTASADDSEHCPSMAGNPPNSTHSTGIVLDQGTADYCEDMDCTDCPPDCGHCVASGHGSCATLTWQQVATHAVMLSPVVAHTSFYQLLSGQPSPPPIIS